MRASSVRRSKELWYTRSHYERVAALPNGWQEELGIDYFIVRFLKRVSVTRRRIPSGEKVRCR